MLERGVEDHSGRVLLLEGGAKGRRDGYPSLPVHLVRECGQKHCHRCPRVGFPTPVRRPLGPIALLVPDREPGDRPGPANGAAWDETASRSEESRSGKECVSTCRCRCTPSL